MFGSRTDDRPTSRGALLLAVAVSIGVGSFVPFGRLLLYPFTLVATWVHEMGHGLTAIAVGGRFEKLEIFVNASGLAYTQKAAGPASAAVALGGLVAPPLLGATILALARGPRRAQILLGVLAAALSLSLVLYVRSVAGFVAVPIVTVLIGLFVRWGSPRERMFLAQFLGLRLAADTLGRLDYLWMDRVVVDGRDSASDIAHVAEGFGAPRPLWSVLVSILCLTLVAAGLFAAWRKPRAHIADRTRTSNSKYSVRR